MWDGRFPLEGCSPRSQPVSEVFLDLKKQQSHANSLLKHRHLVKHSALKISHTPHPQEHFRGGPLCTLAPPPPLPSSGINATSL